MTLPGFLKPNNENLKNAVSAIIGRGVRAVKRFTTALHNKCNLVVYVDWYGRTCCQFLKKDAFSGYHFEFAGNTCLITNKESGDVYSVTYAPTLKCCTCPAYTYSPQPKKHCKHLKMVAELKSALEQSYSQSELEQPQPENVLSKGMVSVLEQTITQAELEQYIEQQAQAIAPPTLPEVTSGRNAAAVSPPEIDVEDVPGCRLRRTDDWLSIEYEVYINVVERIRGVPTPRLKNIGRIVQAKDGICAYRLRPGIERIFQSTQLAIRYLAGVAGVPLIRSAT